MNAPHRPAGFVIKIGQKVAAKFAHHEITPVVQEGNLGDLFDQIPDGVSRQVRCLSGRRVAQHPATTSSAGRLQQRWVINPAMQESAEKSLLGKPACVLFKTLHISNGDDGFDGR
ncbi:hypothetical protein D3C86_1790780 [compost metagenome]